jgi:hypothetical protein
VYSITLKTGIISMLRIQSENWTNRTEVKCCKPSRHQVTAWLLFPKYFYQANTLLDMCKNAFSYVNELHVI